MPGTLYLIATPIGNLEDITLRALRLLKEVDVIGAEDTRQTRKLLAHFGIGTRLVAYHEHSGPAATAALVRRMADGESVALVTDAGSPAISDPGAQLVAAAIDAGVLVSPIPGPATPIAALIASGIAPARFLFEGFLPRTRGPRHERLASLAREQRTLIFFEAANRLASTLGEMARLIAPNRSACVAREITKIHEEFRRGPLSELAAYYDASPPRGECCIVVAGTGIARSDAPADVADDADWKELLRRLAQEAGVDRKDLYKALVDLKQR